MSISIESILVRQRYAIVGKYGSVKLCYWTKESIKSNAERFCYKQKFYGIDSSKCLQCTPCTMFCNNSCKFCWRIRSNDIHDYVSDDISTKKMDDPKDLVTGMIEAQKKLITSLQSTNKEMVKNAMIPKHVAISLSGEPMLYDDIGELVHEFHKKGFTTFIVTNGTLPEKIENITHLPTQLYVTLAASNQKIYNDLCVPKTKDNWEKLMQTLNLLNFG